MSEVLTALDGYSRGPDQIRRFTARSSMCDCSVKGLEGQCWVLPPNLRGGYAVTTLTMDDGRRKTLLVHRVAYMLLVGPIPPGLEIDHRCNVLTCWNPDHMEAVTRLVNMRRSKAGRKPEDHQCRNGHIRTLVNTYTYTDKTGRRYRNCRDCMADRRQDRRRAPGS